MISLLDTSAVLAHLRDEPGADEVEAIFDDRSHEVLLSALTVAELARRLRSLGFDDAAIEARVADYVALSTRVVPVDTDVARAAFDVCGRTPHRLPLVDALIAASALREGARLVHRDRHMAAIPTGVVDQLDLHSGAPRAE